MSRTKRPATRDASTAGVDPSASGWRTRVIRCLALAFMTLSWAACSSDKSYAIVTVRMNEGELTQISQFLVYVTSGDTRTTLYYPASPNSDPTGYRLTPSESIDFSVSFATSYTGDLTIGVEPRNRLDNPLGYGAETKQIDPGHKIRMDVKVVLGALAPRVGGGVDGGAPDTGAGGEGSTGCDPVGATGCRGGLTCAVSCPMTGSTVAPVGVCKESGTGKDGDECRSNSDCSPGTQCFIYGCGRMCRKFCGVDADCPGGSCDRAVACNLQATTFKFCSQTCDPRSSAPNLCKGMFRCLLFANEKASCDCVEATRTGGDGVVCATTASCLPGFMCVAMGTPQPVCRPICKLTDGDCAAGRRCTELVDPKYLTWGACVPQ